MTDPHPSVANISLDGALTVRGVHSVHASLLAALEQHAMIILDCSAATEVDLSLIQLLLAARRTAQRANKTLRLAGADNSALQTALLRGGFVPTEPDGPDPDAPFWLGTTAIP